MIVNPDNNNEYYVECPVCENELNGTQYLGEIWGVMDVVERHARCPKCTYREEMCYSKPFKFICETDTVQNIRKAVQLEIDIVSVDEYELI